MASDEETIQRVTDRLLGRSRTLTLEIQPSEQEDEHVRLTSFIAQLEAFKEVLRHTERVMYGREGGVYYRIVALSQNTPAHVTIEAVPADGRADYGPVLLGQVVENLEILAEAPEDYMPRELDLPALLAYRNVAPTPQRHISGFVVRHDNIAVALDQHFGKSVQTAIGPDQITRSEVVGALEVVNLHRKQRFEIFPTLGDYRVVCRFRPDQKASVIAALDKYVRVSGNVFFKQWSAKPHAIDVERLEVLPDEADIPPFESLRGIAPNLTDEYLKATQDGLW